VALAPLLLLGAGPDVLLLFTVWVSVHGMFQHCNVRLRLGPLNYIFSTAELHRWHHSLKLGPLNYIFSTAELHRWHHSLKLEEANANYGNNILFWDLVFGTVHYPKDVSASSHIGLNEMPDFPKDYMGQILSPWRWDRHNKG
jgi:sterol desaturase/sphingolipid hydroxylase (fatty acid hydroxylase superfamily)